MLSTFRLRTQTLGLAARVSWFPLSHFLFCLDSFRRVHSDHASSHLPHAPQPLAARGIHYKGSPDTFINNSTVPTTKFQYSLPRLPIPELKDTLDRYGGVAHSFFFSTSDL